MEMKEKAQFQRIAELELQLGLLVKLSSSQSMHDGLERSHSTRPKSRASDLTQPKEVLHENIHKLLNIQEASPEIVALLEMSSLLIAEKDRLWSENRSLKSAIKKHNVPSTINDLTSMIGELECMICDERQKKCHCRKYSF